MSRADGDAVQEIAFELPGAGGRAIRGSALVPAGARAAVIICHGFKGFAQWGFLPFLAAAMAKAGLCAIRFDFSGSGIGVDRETFTDADAFADNTFSRELEDLRIVEAESRRRGWLGERYGLLGYSRGGGTAILHAARTPALGALVTLAAIAHPRRWSDEDARTWRERGYAEIRNSRTGQVMKLGTAFLDEVEAEHGGALDITVAASRVTAPWLIIHGESDATIGVADAHRLSEAALDARLLVIEGAGHAFETTHPMGQSTPALDLVVSEAVEWFRRELT